MGITLARMLDGVLANLDAVVLADEIPDERRAIPFTETDFENAMVRPGVVTYERVRVDVHQMDDEILDGTHPRRVVAFGRLPHASDDLRESVRED
jgi:hypothetical protein